MVYNCYYIKIFPKDNEFNPSSHCHKRLNKKNSGRLRNIDDSQ